MSEFHSSNVDRLTGLFNARCAMSELRRVVYKSNSIQYRAVGVIFADIFRFKNLNCSFGHHAGDEILLALVRAIKSRAHADEIACRYGGDEFLIILPDASVSEVARRAEELREAAEKNPIIIGTQEIYLRLSIGIAHSLSLSADSKLRGAEALMRDADAKLMLDCERNVERLAAKSPRDLRQTKSQ